MFQEKAEKIIIEEKLLKKGDRVIAAVSGGPDSLCMLYLLKELRGQLGIDVFAAHLNHGFRPEAEDEFIFVRGLMKKWQLPFYGGRVDVPAYMAEKGLSAQMAARQCRYRFLQKAAEYFKAGVIATGHHRDDQVETILLNIFRGTGLEGLSGIKLRRQWKSYSLIRPLLQVPKEEIIDYCRVNNIETVQDSSNLKGSYRRNKIRLSLLPLIAEEYNPSIDEALLRLAFSAGEDNDYLEKKARFFFSLYSCRVNPDKIFINSYAIAGLHLSLQRRILKLCWQSINRGNAPTLEAKHIASIIELYTQKPAGKKITLPGKIQAINVRGGMVFSREKNIKNKNGNLFLNIPGDTKIEEVGVTFNAEIIEKEKLKWPPDEKTEAFFDADKVSLPLYVRFRHAGDIFRPFGMNNQKKKLKDFFIDKKIPIEERDLYPLVLSGDEILWVTGLAVAHNSRITGETLKAIILRLKVG